MGRPFRFDWRDGYRLAKAVSANRLLPFTLPDEGTPMPITPLMPVYPRSPVRPVRGEGVYLYGEGREISRFRERHSSTCGHGHPHLTKALQEQAATLLHVSNLYTAGPAGRSLCPAAVDLTFADTVFFTNRRRRRSNARSRPPLPSPCQGQSAQAHADHLSTPSTDGRWRPSARPTRDKLRDGFRRC